MSRFPAYPKEHKCDLKKKLADLAEEVSAREDDGCFSELKQYKCSVVSDTSSTGGCCRESLATLDLLPVSARKARWERLMAIESSENPQVSLIKSRVAQLKGHTMPDSSGPHPPVVVRSTISQAERERLERQAELAELRRAKRQPLKEISDSTDTHLSSAIPSVPSIAQPQPVGFILPPAPSPTPVVDMTICAADAAMLPSSHSSSVSSECSLEERCPMESLSSLRAVEEAVLPEPPNLKMNSSVSADIVLTAAVDDISTDAIDMQPATFHSHEYYSRSKFSANRGCLDVPSESQLPRQRSVTFEPEPGTAPGDTTSEGTVESDVGSLCHSTFSNSCIEPTSGTTPFPLKSNSDECTVLDSEFSEIIDTALEEAAADAILVSPNVEDKRSLSNASAYDLESDDGADVDVVCSDPEITELHPPGQNVTPRCRRDHRVLLNRRNSSTHSPSTYDHLSLQSCMTAAALIDGEATTPLKSICQNRISQPCKAESLISESQRRISRLAELPRLLQVEQDVILQASTALRQYTAQLDQAQSGKHEHAVPKRSRFGFDTLSVSCRPPLCGSISVPYIEANLKLVVACQRRQVLMEELAMLHRGFPVLTPAARGDPIRARLRLNAVRLGLKPFRNPDDPSSGGGYIVLSTETTGRKAALSARALSTVTQYHFFAILKCRGEGRLYHTEMVTVAHASDLPVGFGHPATYVDLPANIDIVPLRPNFVISLEIYCMRIGLDSVDDVVSVSSPGLPTPIRAGCRSNEPASGRSKKARLDPSPRGNTSKVFAACLSASYLVSPSRSVEKTPTTGQNKLAAFSLLSSVDIQYHDDLLLGRIRTDGDSSTFSVTASSRPNSLPLRLPRLPRSTPLTGFAGLIDAAVSLEARVLTRGFLTIFEEVDGLGVWRRYWCQLRADHMRFWLYPENEQSGPGSAPLGRIDLRHVAAPRAVPAPRRICARANTIFMRSIRAIEPGWLSAAVSTAGSSADSNESILFRSSPDHGWLEQRHLLCADTMQERDSWIKWFNLCLDALNDWMPEHFACLAAYDARLDFSQPISSNLSALLMHGDG